MVSIHKSNINPQKVGWVPLLSFLVTSPLGTCFALVFFYSYRQSYFEFQLVHCSRFPSCRISTYMCQSNAIISRVLHSCPNPTNLDEANYYLISRVYHLITSDYGWPHWRITLTIVGFWHVYQQDYRTRNPRTENLIQRKIFLKFISFRLLRQNSWKKPSWCALSCV